MVKATHVLFLFFGVAMVVLILTHAKGFAGAFTAIGGQTNQFANFLTGTTSMTPGGKPTGGLPGSQPIIV